MKAKFERANILFAAIVLSFCVYSCSKDEIRKEPQNAIEQSLQIFAESIKAQLKDSLSESDFSAINFDNIYTSKDTQASQYYIRIAFKGNKISDDFVLLKTDSTFKIIRARIVHVDLGTNEKSITANAIVKTSSLNRKEILCIRNKSNKNNRDSKNLSTGDVSYLMAEEVPAGEQVLPDVVVTGYIYDDGMPYYWYCYDGMLGLNDGGYTYTYGSSDPGGGGGSTPSVESTIQIDFENPEDLNAIDIEKYLKCFGTTQEADAIYTITIATDIPVDGDPSQFFDWSNSSPGHTFIELYKNGSGGLIEQNIGFYPNSSWKTASGENISSKMVDNANHEYNSRYSISLNNTQFQAALTAIKAYSSNDYNIANYNCTDFALNVFNSAGGNLTIPRYTIPGFSNGPYGSSTPQGLYTKLDQMQYAGFSGIQKPGIKGFADNSHGPCD